MWTRLLNKITGCESRTVPPLYVPRSSLLAKASHWVIPGKAERNAGEAPHRHESEDLRSAWTDCALRVMGLLDTEKRPWHLSMDATAF